MLSPPLSSPTVSPPEESTSFLGQMSTIWFSNVGGKAKWPQRWTGGKLFIIFHWYHWYIILQYYMWRGIFSPSWLYLKRLGCFMYSCIFAVNPFPFSCLFHVSLSSFRLLQQTDKQWALRASSKLTSFVPWCGRLKNITLRQHRPTHKCDSHEARCCQNIEEPVSLVRT